MIRKGTYVLLITLGADADIDVGALGTLHFSEGQYCYVGSAMGGLDQRVSRHIRKEKKVKWHADYITVKAESVEAFESYPDFIPECDLARMAEASGMKPSHKGFGCSDCGCSTHLFRVEPGSMDRLLEDSGMKPFQ